MMPGMEAIATVHIDNPQVRVTTWSFAEGATSRAPHDLPVVPQHLQPWLRLPPLAVSTPLARLRASFTVQGPLLAIRSTAASACCVTSLREGMRTRLFVVATLMRYGAWMKMSAVAARRASAKVPVSIPTSR